MGSTVAVMGSSWWATGSVGGPREASGAPVSARGVGRHGHMRLRGGHPEQAESDGQPDPGCLDQPQAGLGQGGVDVVGQDRTVVVEAVESGGQAAHPGGDLGRGPVDGGVGHHLGEVLEAADELELALVGEKGEIDLGQRGRRHPRSAALRPHPADAGLAICT